MVKVILALWAMILSSTVSAQTVPPDALNLELAFEERSGPLYTGEMVLLKVRGSYKIRIAREQLVQPSLDGFDWMQLGEDDWTKDLSQGGEILKFERVIALFPNRAGTIQINPFSHELELWTRTGERYDHTLPSDSLSIDVTERPTQEAWWMPARRLTVDDTWSNAPDKLGTGEGALRVVTLTVEGVRPEQIPPMPEMESAGALVFPHPEVRRTRLYRRGPVTRVIWRWTVRPEDPPSAYLKPIRVPYFDTKTREHSEIVISAQRIAMTEDAVAAYLAEANPDSVRLRDEAGKGDRETSDLLRYAGAVAPLAFIAGLFGGLALMIPGIGQRRWSALGEALRRLQPDPDIRALKRAVSHADRTAARRAAMRLIGRGEGDLSGMRDAVASFDRHVYGQPQSEPDLREFKAAILRAMRTERR